MLLLLLLTDAGHLWTCVENKEKAREWVWRRISVGKRFTQVACSRNHYAAIARKEVRGHISSSSTSILWAGARAQ